MVIASLASDSSRAVRTEASLAAFSAVTDARNAAVDASLATSIRLEVLHDLALPCYHT
jgi:hypothetical protein